MLILTYKNIGKAKKQFKDSHFIEKINKIFTQKIYLDT